jgi:ribonuclease HII
MLGRVRRRTGRKLLQFDRKLGARFVAGADEAGRGPLAGPLLVAGVLLDYAKLHDHRVRPLACLNDSKQCSEAEREELFRAVVSCAERIVVRAISPGEIDREGLHRSNLAGMRAVLHELSPPAEVCLVDGFRLGPSAPEHQRVVDGDEKSAAIAAASIIAKVTRDRMIRRTASARTSATSRRGTAPRYARSGRPISTAARSRRSATRSTRAAGRAAERRAWWFYRLRGYRILDTNVWLGGYELDLVVRRGRRLVFVEVKAKGGPRFGDPLEMVTPEKQRRLRRAAEAWLAAHPEAARLAASFEVVSVAEGRLERLRQAF